MSFDLGQIGITAIRRITDLWRGGKADSLIDYTRVTRVEPTVLIDTDCLFMDDDTLMTVQQSLLSQFAGYYLQAIAIATTTIQGVEVFRTLDRLNPHRSPADSAADSAGWLMAQENYKDGLPFLKSSYAVEDEEKATSFALGRDTTTALRELADLSVGKQLNVDIQDGTHRATLPISVRLMASSLPSKNLVHILSIGNKDNSAKERYWAWKADRLGTIRDMVLCLDLIAAHKRNLMEDSDNVYANIIKRNRSNQLSTLVSGNPSVATASNMVILTDTTADALETEINARLSDFKTREKLFKETSLMIMAVINKSFRRVTFYYRGLAQHTDLGINALKASNKGGPDVADILRAYQVGQAPSL